MSGVAKRSSPIFSLGRSKPKIDESAWIAPNAAVIGNVVLEKNSSVWFNATLRGDNAEIRVSEGSNIQDGSVLHTDIGLPLVVGRNVTVGHMVMLHGCEIGENSLIGIGSVILNGAKIGKNCIIGAKTLIAEGKTIPDNSLVMGSPGKIVRTITDAQARMLKMSADGYVANAKRFEDELSEIPRSSL
eukprot:g1788.t1